MSQIAEDNESGTEVNVSTSETGEGKLGKVNVQVSIDLDDVREHALASAGADAEKDKATVPAAVSRAGRPD